MTDTTADAGIEFPIDQQLLEEATHAREQWRVLSDRLARIKEHKDRVSPLVHERVRKDYEGRLEAARQQMMQKKELIDRELTNLRETRKKINVQLQDHRHKLEEIKFRNTLGEFSEEEYQAAAKVEQDKIAKFETILNAVDNNIGRYEAIFAEDKESFEEEEKEEQEEEAPAPKEEKPARKEVKVEKVEEAATQPKIEEGGPDYFSSMGSETTNPEIEESATAKTAPPQEDIKRRSRVVIISGDEAGATYPLKGTVSFGRAESNTIVIKDAKVSRQHAQIQQQGNEYVIVDLNSSNGTFVNSQRIEEHVLSNGDEIMIGDCMLQFQD